MTTIHKGRYFQADDIDGALDVTMTEESGSVHSRSEVASMIAELQAIQTKDGQKPLNIVIWSTECHEDFESAMAEGALYTATLPANTPPETVDLIVKAAEMCTGHDIAWSIINA